MIATTDSRLAIQARLFRGLGDQSRLALLQALREGERTVGELVALTGLRQSNVSGHLACLRACGLVEPRQEWRNVYYRLAGPHVEHLFQATDLVLAAVADHIAACTRPEMEGPDG